jgi:hypothetical protein
MAGKRTIPGRFEASFVNLVQMSSLALVMMAIVIGFENEKRVACCS